jgi:hypothetical protein
MTDQKGTRLCATYSRNLIVVVLSKQKNDVMAICDDVMTSLHNR